MKVLAYIFIGSFLLTGCFFQKKQAVVNTSDFTKIDFPEHITNVFDLSKDYLYYQAYKGDIVKWNRQRKQEEWRYSNPSKRPAIAYLATENLIYFSEWGGNPIVALDFKGNKELEIEDDVFGYSNTFIEDTNGIVVLGVSGVSKLNFDKKSIDWKINCFSTSTKCNLAAADAGNSVIVGGLGDSLSFEYDNILSIDKRSGKENWTYRLKGEVITEIAVGKKNIFVGVKAPSSEKATFNDANYLLCLGKLSGKLIWKKQYEFTHGTEVLFKGDTLFFNSQDELYSVNAENGSLNWSKKFPPFVEILGVYKDNILLKRTDGIELVSPNNGNTQREIKAVINAGPWFLKNTLGYYSDGSIFISQF